MYNLELIVNDFYNAFYNGYGDIPYRWYTYLSHINEPILISDTFLMVIGRGVGNIYPLFTTYAHDVVVRTVFNYIIYDKEKQNKIRSMFPPPVYNLTRQGKLVKNAFFEYVFDINKNSLLHILQKTIGYNRNLSEAEIYKIILYDILCNYQLIPDIFLPRSRYLQEIESIVYHLKKFI